MATLIPRELLFGNPERARPSIAPDGRRLAFLAPQDGVLNVWVGELGGDRFEPVTHDRERGVRAYFWAEDGRHLIYVQDAGGDENWRLYAVDPAAGRVRDLTPFDGVQARVLAHDRRRPDELVVALNRDDARLHDAYLLRIGDGRLVKLAANPGDLEPWIVDADMRVRGALRQLPDGGAEVAVADGDDPAARTLLRVSPEDALSTWPVGVDGSGGHLHLVTSHGAEAARLCRIPLAGGEPEEIAADPRYDVDDVVVDPVTQAVQIVSFMRQRRELVVLDERLADDVRCMQDLGRGDLAVGNRDHADRTWIVTLLADDAPPAYHAYDRIARSGRFLFSADSRFAGRRLARTEPFTLQARDGLELHGYLTFPPGAGRERLPTV